MRRRSLKAAAFTLIELMIVITIIGILVAFILRAAMGGIKQAEQKATVALIAKLEAGMTDRMDALASQHPEPTAAHYVLAQSYHSGVTFNTPASQRAQVLAQYDMLRAELPDVFVVQAPISGSGLATYPLNFGGAAWGDAGSLTDYFLPLGANIPYLPANSGYNFATYLNSSPALANQIGITQQNTLNVRPAGIYGASFAAAAGIYKQLGYGPQGTDGADNDGDNFIDDLKEGMIGLDATAIADMATRLGNHKHETARAEMLYAVLIEGIGPLGSVFQKDDFNDQEVKDTDGDGLLEFVDAWGKPLQFFRWPILYRSDVQRGFPDLAKLVQDQANGLTPGPYTSVYENREVNTLDPNQQLLSPAWWTTYNTGYFGGNGQNGVSDPAITFARHFHTLVEPLAITGGKTSNATYWDRSTDASKGFYARRAYYSRFLIVSGGEDRIPGVAQLGVDYRQLDDRSQFPIYDPTTKTTSYATARDSSGAPVPVAGPAADPTLYLRIEDEGAQVDPNRTGPFLLPSFGTNYRNDTNTFLRDHAGSDDITSQNLNSLGGPISR